MQIYVRFLMQIRMYVLGLNEIYVMHMYVAYIWEERWQWHKERNRRTERDRQRETTIMCAAGSPRIVL